MGQNRASDVVVGLTMIAIGLSPCGLVLLGHLRPVEAAARLGIDSAQFGTVLILLSGFFGLFLAGMDVITLRYGRTTSTPSLY